MEFLGLRWEQLEKALQPLEIELQVIICRFVDMLLSFLLRFCMLIYLTYYFFNSIAEFLSFIISLYLLIMHYNHMRLMPRLRHYQLRRRQYSTVAII